MKLSLNWLSEMLTLKEKNPRTLAERITLMIAEVEELEEQGRLLDHCCVGKILTLARHPNADRLSLVDVETDKGRKRVVCGGTNLRDGMLVAFAHVGATVRWHGTEMMTLQPVKIRGEASEGMICAAEELDLKDRFPTKGEHDIIDLSEEAKSSVRIGSPLRDALHLDDTIFHISNTAITHRGDLFSHVGFARELVAAGLGTWKEKKEPSLKLPTFPSTSPSFTVELEEKSLVPRYLACTIELATEAETPHWMKQRLEAVGVRPISLPVDITNFVMLEQGSPLHAFDAAKIRGKTIAFREAGNGETVTTLDGTQREVPKGAIVLSDTDGIFDLCGLMGDLRTAMNDKSRSIFLHAPVFDPVRTRKTIQATGLRSDASTIFEKGVPAVSAARGFARALQLFLELSPGARIASKKIEWGTDGKAKPIALSMERLSGTMGVGIPAKEAAAILQGLGCIVRSAKNSLTVTPPLHRLRDLTMDADIVEEVARLHGYDRIPLTLPEAPMRLPTRDARLVRLRTGLKEEGFLEIVPLSFLSPGVLQKCGMNPADVTAVRNPLSEETALLQPSTLPGLLTHAERNILHTGDALQTVQIGHVFGKNTPEHTECGVLIASMTETNLAHDPFLILKQSLRSALHGAGYALSIAPLATHPPFAHPGRSAVIAVNGQGVGMIFEVHPTVRGRFGLRHRAAAATFDLTALFGLPPASTRATPIPQFPAVTYDVTLTRSHAEPFGPLLQKLRGGHPLLEHVDVHDLYAGKPLSNEQYNLTLRFTYRSPERTLTEEEAKAAHEQVMATAGV